MAKQFTEMPVDFSRKCSKPGFRFCYSTVTLQFGRRWITYMLRGLIPSLGTNKHSLGLDLHKCVSEFLDDSVFSINNSISVTDFKRVSLQGMLLARTK